MSSARDQHWFTSLHARTAGDITRYALRRAGRTDAEDVVGETFLVAWRRRTSVPEPPEDLLWLYGVARNTIANTTRSARRRERLVERLRSERPPESVVDADDPSADTVREALDRLAPLDAEVLRLIAWEGLSHREVAVALETSENAVALRASRARRRLSTLLTDLHRMGT